MTNDHPGCAQVVLAALVGVTRVFSDLATWLRKAPGFSRVTQQCSMSNQRRRDEHSFEVGQGEGLLVEWYADAEHESGAALSFGMSLTLSEGEWTIESSVRAVDREGENTLFDLAERCAVDDDELVQELSGAASALGAARESAALEFQKRYVTREGR